jgi:hypothetical protein
MGAFGAAALGVAGTVGATLLSNSSKSDTSTASGTKAPWINQQPYLQDQYANAQSIYDTRTAAGPFTGNYVAPGNSVQQGAIDNANAYAAGTGAALPGQVAGTATDLMGAAQPYVGNAAGIAANGITAPNAGLTNTLNAYGTGATTTSGPSAPLSSALNAAAVSGANSLGTFGSGLQSTAAYAAANPTAQTVANASQFANNPGVQAALDSTNAQIRQTLSQQTDPSINRAAAVDGALNSSRAGMSMGMANQAAATAQGSADASILNNAYTTGTNAAVSQYGTGLNASINANSLGYNDASAQAANTATTQQGLNEFNTNTTTNAANAGLSQGLNANVANANTKLSANSQLGTATGLGINGAASASNDATSAFALGSAAGALQQTNAQAALTNSLDQWTGNNTYQQGVLANYIADTSGNPGSVSTSSATPAPNYVGAALGGAAAGAALYQNYFGNGSTPTSTSGVVQNPSLVPPDPGAATSSWNSWGPSLTG